MDVINIIISNDLKVIEVELDYILNDNFDHQNKELLIYLTEQASITKKLKLKIV